MTNRYAIRCELSDGTLEEALLTVATKRDAIRYAKFIASNKPSGAVRVWVDDTKADLLVTNFSTGR